MDQVDVENYYDNYFVLTPQQDSRFTTYHGDDWEEVKEILREREGIIKGLQIFNPDIKEFSSFDELLEAEKELEKLIGDADYEDIKENYEYVRGFNSLDKGRFGQMLKSVSEKLEDVKKEKVQSFGKIYSSLGEESREDLHEYLETDREEHKLGKDLFNIGSKRRYLDFVDYEFEEVDKILLGRGSLPRPDDFFEDNSPYKKFLESLFEDYEEELKKITYLGERAGIDVSFEVEKKLKSWEWKRKESEEDFEAREIDEETEEWLRGKLEQEIETKKRDYTIKALQSIGKEQVKDKYRKATGKNKEEFTQNEIEALKLHKRCDEDIKSPQELEEDYKFIRTQKTVEKLLKHKNEVYDLEENQKWLERKGYDLKDLTGFEYQIDSIEARNVEKIIEYKGMENNLEGVPDSLRIEVADPMETVQMGNHFSDSCLAVEKKNRWSAASNAVDVNKQVLYAYNEDNEVVGRVLTGITEKGELTYFSVYDNTEVSLEPTMEEAVTQYGEQLGLEVVEGNKDIEKLEAERWYSAKL